MHWKDTVGCDEELPGGACVQSNKTSFPAKHVFSEKKTKRLEMTNIIPAYKTIILHNCLVNSNSFDCKTVT